MTLEEALTVGLISIEDLQKMGDGFSMSGLDLYIVGKTVTSKSDGSGTVISVHTDLPVIYIDFGGTVHAISYPEGSLQAVRFDDKKFQDYIDARIGVYEATLEWGAAFDEPECLYALYIFRTSQGKEDEAFEFLCRAAKEGEECAQDCILGHCSRRIEDGLAVDDETIQFALNLYKNRAS